jgi:DNA polymerase V
MLADLPLDQPFPCRSSGSGSDGLDLHELIVPNPICTFFMRVAGDGLRSHGVLDGDLLVIDRSIEPSPGCLVVVAHRGEFLLRPLRFEASQCLLAPIHPGEEPIPVAFEDVHSSPLFGVAVQAVHQLGPAPSRRR